MKSVVLLILCILEGSMLGVEGTLTLYHNQIVTVQILLPSFLFSFSFFFLFKFIYIYIYIYIYIFSFF